MKNVSAIAEPLVSSLKTNKKMPHISIFDEYNCYAPPLDIKR